MLVILSGGRPKENIRQLVDQGEKDAGYPTEDVSSDKACDEGCPGRNVYHYGNPCVQHDDFHSLILKIKTVSLICVCFPVLFLDVFREAESLRRPLLLSGVKRIRICR